MKTSTGGTPYAIGILSNGWFRIRAIRFGKLAASYELREHEEIHAVALTVADKKARPSFVLETVFPIKVTKTG